MSSSTPGETSTLPSNFNSILDAALSGYEKTTGRELLEHPLAIEIQQCDSVHAILAILQGRARKFQKIKDGDQRLTTSINPIVDVLYTISETYGGFTSMTIPPAGAAFTGIGALLSAAKDVRVSHNALVELFQRMENLFKRLGVYTHVSLTDGMAEVFVKIVAEVLSILSIATKEANRKRTKNYLRKLLGRRDIEDAFKKSEALIQEEVRMAVALTLKANAEHQDEIKRANDDISSL
ncbi:hypothetical protein EI94DRAFT_1704213 [Lactarius quietus]|nr:hypothetical protein EI94DRAFT_1704213 [Lactarius quietus]